MKLRLFSAVQKAKVDQAAAEGNGMLQLIPAEGAAAATAAPQIGTAAAKATSAGPAAGDTATGPAKPRAARPKAAELDAAQVQAKVMGLFAAGQQQKLTLPEMKCFLRARKVPVGGVKADLLVRVRSLLNMPAL